MRPSAQYPVPADIALLYDFLNSVDFRRFVERGAAHATSDALATVAQLEGWLREHELLESGARSNAAQHRRAIQLSGALRAFIQPSG